MIDPRSAWTAKANRRVQFGYGLNYSIDIDYAVIVDVRDKDEFQELHIPDAVNISRGLLEYEVEEKYPDRNTTIICHCGGGGRSALAAESLQKMGYKNVRSMAGGFRAWKAAGLPTTK